MLRERRRHANFKPNRKLDRKSSRGMIYENEELRLRTININAEVERGQSDIKKLRRENYQLRKEIWSLRDEYDRLGKLLKVKTRADFGFPDSDADCHDHEHHGADTDYKYECDYDENDRCCSCHSNEDNLTCDMCNDSEHCAQEFDSRTNGKASHAAADCSSGQCAGASNATSQSVVGSTSKAARGSEKNLTFDHLSVVSEECTSNSDDQSEQKKASKPPSVGTGSKVCDEFQANVPPLAHFENLSYRDIGPNLDSLEMIYNKTETPPPPTPPPLPKNKTQSNGSYSDDFPLPPPSIAINDELEQPNESQLQQTVAAPKIIKPKPKYFFAPLKSKRKQSTPAASDNNRNESQPPDLYISNVVPTEGNRLATIRKPHNPLKCPTNLETSEDTAGEAQALDAILHDIQDLSKGIEAMQIQTNPIYQNIDASTDSNAEEHPYRTEMSLVLSYNGNKSKYKSHDSDKTSDVTDIDTPPPSIPQAMALLPSKLTYAMKCDDRTAPAAAITITKTSPSPTEAIDTECNINTENHANEEIYTKSQVKHVSRSNSNGKHADATTTKAQSATKKLPVNGESSTDNGKSQNEIKATESRTANDSETTLTVPDIEPQSQSKHTRRVSIHFNGRPMTEEEKNSNEPPPPQPQKADEATNIVDEIPIEEAEAILLTPTLACRRASRRNSMNRKFSDDSIGSFLLAPTSQFLFSKSSKKQCLPRRHSDISLLPRSEHSQYYNECGQERKSSHRHRYHGRHHHHGTSGMYANGTPIPNNLGVSNAIGGSTGTSICNSLGSSGDSSNSLSQRSASQQKRKLSITSHSQSGGKIPWCACWGNGCL